MSANMRRVLKRGKDLPPDSWLYDHSGAWRMMPSQHPDLCSWDGTKLEVKDGRWRSCPKCDTPEAAPRKKKEST